MRFSCSIEKFSCNGSIHFETSNAQETPVIIIKGVAADKGCNWSDNIIDYHKRTAHGITTRVLANKFVLPAGELSASATKLGLIKN